MDALLETGLRSAVRDGKPLLITVNSESFEAAIDSGYPWTIKLLGLNFIELLDQSLLKKIKSFVLSDDRINFELQKIFKPERCKFITYPGDYTKLNDIRAKYGDQSVIELILKAKDYPVVGLYRPDEFPPIPASLKTTYSTGLGWWHDQLIKIILGKFMVVTGIPGHGKSLYVDIMVLNFAIKHGWKICVCSTEVDNEEYEVSTIRRKLRRPLDQVGKHEPAKAKQFYQDHFVFITNNTMDVEIELTIEKLIDLATIAIIRDDCKVLVIDPWSEIEHKRYAGENETEYTGRAIRMLKKLAKQYFILVIVVAHPKMPMQGKPLCPNLYSISGSAQWFNKADYGIIIWRESLEGNCSEVRVAKIKRHGYMGKPGSICLTLNPNTQNFEEEKP